MCGLSGLRISLSAQKKDRQSSITTIISGLLHPRKGTSLCFTAMNQQVDRVDLNEILTQVLDGKQQIVSYAGTSQYHVQDVGKPGSERTTISACGLIALNCARTVFRLHRETNRPLPVDTESERDPVDLIRSVLSEQTTEVRSGIGLIRDVADCNSVGNHIYIVFVAQY